MKCEITAFEPQRKLAAKFPFDPRFLNPAGVQQGGMIAVALDNLWGPLSFDATGKICTTIELSCSYIRPFLEKDRFMHAEVEVVSITRSIVIMNGRVTQPQGKLIAVGSTQIMVLQNQPEK
jgi:uncharacterized protein (TIGR00369 family)